MLFLANKDWEIFLLGEQIIIQVSCGFIMEDETERELKVTEISLDDVGYKTGQPSKIVNELPTFIKKALFSYSKCDKNFTT